jgi:hypothetical protein
MLEKFGVHGVASFLGAGKNKGTITKMETGINSTENQFYTSTFELPQEMALVLVLAQDCNVQLQQQQRGGGKSCTPIAPS